MCTISMEIYSKYLIYSYKNISPKMPFQPLAIILSTDFLYGIVFGVIKRQVLHKRNIFAANKLVYAWKTLDNNKIQILP